MPETARLKEPFTSAEAGTETPRTLDREANAGTIECWNGILTPKWLRFRDLLSGNGQVHSDMAYPML